MRILFTGGGTGGHIYPLVAIAREIRRLYPKNNLELYYIGPKDELGQTLLSQEDFIVKTIVSGKLRRYFSVQNIIDILFKIPIGFLQSIFLLMVIRPKLVFSKGGSGSFVVAYSAKLLKTPLFLHESDAVPGLSNQKASKWAKKIFVSFPRTEYFDPSKIILTGNPTRRELLEGDKQSAGQLFDLTFSKPIFLVVGGSQGAEAINDFILLILNDLLRDYEIIHVTGRQNFEQVEKEAEAVIDENFKKYYHLESFLDEEKAKQALFAADLIISRAGSSNIFETAASGKPSILVPLPNSAGNHQAKNAYVYADEGCCIVLEQANLTPNLFFENVKLLVLNPEKLKKMQESALSFAKPLAARAIAREILEFFMLD